MLINETEAIANCINSLKLLSEETAIAQHPWVTDPQTEAERLKAQKANPAPIPQKKKKGTEMTFNEQLRELNLTEEQLKTINTALKAEYVPKTEYERLFDNLNAAKSEHKKKTEFLKQSAADKLERQKRLYELKLKDNLVDIAIEEAGAKSREIVRALIDTEKVEISLRGLLLSLPS